jgi:hypothetical protein
MLGNVFLYVCRLLATQSQNGHNHLIILVDDHARKASTHGPCDKPQVPQALKAFTLLAKPSVGQEVKVPHSDGSNNCTAGHLQDVPHHAAPLHDTSPTHTLDFALTFFGPQWQQAGHPLTPSLAARFSCMRTCMANSTPTHLPTFSTPTTSSSTPLHLMKGGPHHHHQTIILDHNGSTPLAATTPSLKHNGMPSLTLVHNNDPLYTIPSMDHGKPPTPGDDSRGRP